MSLTSSFKSALFIVVFSLISVYVGAAPLNPSQGLKYLSKIPKSQIHQTFCQTLPGEKGVVTNDPRYGRGPELKLCEDAVDILKKRLIELSEGQTNIVIDEELIKNVAHLFWYLYDRDTGYRAPPVSHTLQPDSQDSANEFIAIAQQQFEITGAAIDSWLPNSSPSPIKLTVPFKDFPPREFPLPKGENGLLGINVAGVPAESISQYLSYLTGKINTDLTTPDEVEELERQIIMYSKMILLTHPFENGNTRTSLLMMNYLRMVMGLEPYRTYSLPRIAAYSSFYIQRVTKIR